MAAITWRNVAGAGGDASSFMRLATEGVEDATSSITGAIQQYGSDKQSLNDQLIEKNTNRFLDVLNEAKTPGAVADVQDRLTSLREGGFIDRDAIRGAERNRETKLRSDATADYEYQQSIFAQEAKPLTDIFDGFIAAGDGEGAGLFLEDSDNRQILTNAGVYDEAVTSYNSIPAYLVQDTIAAEPFSKKIEADVINGNWENALAGLEEHKGALELGGVYNDSLSMIKTAMQASTTLSTDNHIKYLTDMETINVENQNEVIGRQEASISKEFKETLNGTHNAPAWQALMSKNGFEQNAFWDNIFSKDSRAEGILDEVVTELMASPAGKKMNRVDMDQLMTIALNDLQPGSSIWSNNDVTQAKTEIEKAVRARLPRFIEDQAKHANVLQLKLNMNIGKLQFTAQMNQLEIAKDPNKDANELYRSNIETPIPRQRDRTIADNNDVDSWR